MTGRSLGRYVTGTRNWCISCWYLYLFECLPCHCKNLW